MKDLGKFMEKFDNFSTWEKTDQVDFIAFFLTKHNGKKSIVVKDIRACFDELNIKQYARLPAYLSDNSSSLKGKYVKKNKGYSLEMNRFNEIKKTVENEPEKVEVSKQLSNLLSQIKDSSEKEFLLETMNCYRVQSFRAFIVMTWILTIYHLQKYILGKKLSEFNTALAKNPDRKISKIINYEEFSDLKESKFIEITRSAGIISNDVRKILDEKLGTRNSAAHPSGIIFAGHKATEFALDLISNVLLKY